MKKKKIIPYDDYNGKIPPPDRRDVIGTVRQTFGVYALRNGWKIIELYEEEEEDGVKLCNEWQE